MIPMKKKLWNSLKKNNYREDFSGSLKLKRNSRKRETKAHNQGSTKDAAGMMPKILTENGLELANMERTWQGLFSVGARIIKKRYNYDFSGYRKIAKLVRYPFPPPRQLVWNRNWRKRVELEFSAGLVLVRTSLSALMSSGIPVRNNCIPETTRKSDSFCE